MHHHDHVAHSADTTDPASGPSRRRFLSNSVKGAGLTLAVGALPALPAAVTQQGAGAAALGPIIPPNAPVDLASFVDPTATVTRPQRVRVRRKVYVGPFSLLDAVEGRIVLDDECNVQDNVVIRTAKPRRGFERRAIAALGLRPATGVHIGEKAILAHGCSVIGPAIVGVEGGDPDPDPDHDVGVFLSFGAVVDGAIVEKKCVVSALARVGPGVRLRTGTVVLPGKNVTTQAEADDPALGKIRFVEADDIAFKEAVVEVNVSLAREYTRLYREDRSAVLGVNVDPGGSSFNPDRDVPVLDGVPTRDPGFRNRIIGAVTMDDPLSVLDDVMGAYVSIRADEGEPMAVGAIVDMRDNVTFHSLEHTGITVGDNVTYGERCIVHGGARTEGGAVVENETVVEDDVVIGPGAVVFRSRVGAGAVIGARSVVVNSLIAPGTVIPERVIVSEGVIVGPVEWE